MLAQLLWKQGDRKTALEQFDEAVALAPDLPEAHYNRSLAAQSADAPGVVTEFREALRLKSDDARGHCNLGLALYRIGDREASSVEFRRARKLDATFSPP